MGNGCVGVVEQVGASPVMKMAFSFGGRKYNKLAVFLC